MRWLDSISNSMDMNLGNLLEIKRNRGAWRAAVHEVTELDTAYQLNNTISRKKHLLTSSLY